MKKQPAAVDRSITGPMLKPILDLQANKGAKKEGTIPSLTPEKLKPAAEYQDDGGGYNSNLFFPQE